MLIYRNIKTGAVITVPCPVQGDWELVDDGEAKPKQEPTPKKKTAKKKK